MLTLINYNSTASENLKLEENLGEKVTLINYESLFEFINAAKEYSGVVEGVMFNSKDFILNERDVKIIFENTPAFSYDFINDDSINLKPVLNTGIMREPVDIELNKIVDKLEFILVKNKITNTYSSSEFRDDSSIVIKTLKSQFGIYYTAQFAIELISVFLPDQTLGVNDLSDRNWHLSLLKFFYKLYPEAIISIKYETITINNLKQVKVFIIISLSGKIKEKTILEAGKIKESLLEFFYSSGVYLVYDLRIVKSKEELEAAVYFIDLPLNITSYKLKIKESVSLFYNDIISSDKKVEKELLNALFFTNQLLYSYDKLLSILTEQHDGSAFVIHLKPFTPESYIKSLSNEIKYLNNPEIRETDKINILDKLESSMFFKTVVLIYNKQNEVSNTLKHNINSDLFNADPGFEINEGINNPADIFNCLINNSEIPEEFANIFTAVEAASCFHLPFRTNFKLSGVQSEFSRFSFVPAELSTEGTLLGIKRRGELVMDIRIKDKDLNSHTYIIGQTGTGKSTMLYTMIMDQIENDKGVLIIDPNLDLCNKIAENLPAHRKNDIIIFDPTEEKYQHRINLLEYDINYPAQKSFIINEQLKIINDIYNLNITGGPVFELYFTNALLAVMENKGSIFDVVNFFLYTDKRKEILENCSNVDVINFFNNANQTTGEISFTNILFYIISKFTPYTLNEFFKNVFNTCTSDINFRDIIDNKKIFLARLPKGILGDKAAHFMGIILVNRFVMAALSRANIHEKDRRQFFMYIDEFQNFVSTDSANALAEARKYGLSMILANQTTAQIPKELKEIIIGNVGNTIFFRAGSHELSTIMPYIFTDFKEDDVLYLPNYQCIAKLLVDGKPTKPFVFETAVM
ncbi:MAG: DUF87 domain-containing protein [Ignavibacteriae bacterium]|nr:MAG: DUF87 domain-containing protein [Ignavibacteriota bacterium]